MEKNTKLMKNAFDAKRDLRDKDNDIKFLIEFQESIKGDKERIENDLDFNRALKIEKDAKM